MKNCRSEILSNGVSERISGNFSSAGDFSLPSFLFIVEKKADVITGFNFNIKRFVRM